MIRAVVACTLAVLLVAAAWSPRPVRADAVVGTGTASSCTESALNAALGCGAPSGSPRASNCAGGGSVTFDCGGAATITVTSTKTISGATTIDGGSLITISGENTVGVFFVNTGVNFTVQNLTIANGNSASYGGGIHNGRGGAVTVTNSTFSGNSASNDNPSNNSGGGPEPDHRQRQSRSSCGGIYNDTTLTVTQGASGSRPERAGWSTIKWV